MKHYEEDQEWPVNLDDFQSFFSCKIVFTNDEDIDRLCVQRKYRLAIYVNASELKRLLCFIDDFIHWRARLEGRDEIPFPDIPKVKIFLQPGCEVSFVADDEMLCPLEVTEIDTPCVRTGLCCNVESDQHQVHLLDADPPCYPRRLIIANLECVNRNLISIVFSGNTLMYRELFDAARIGGTSIKAKPTDEYGEYFRDIRDKNLSSTQDRAWLVSIFGDLVLKNSPIIVRVKSRPQDDELFNVFLGELRQCPNVYFDM